MSVPISEVCLNAFPFYYVVIIKLYRFHYCLKMTDGMRLGPSCLHKWMLVWEEEWQRSLYLELIILQQVGFHSILLEIHVYSFKDFSEGVCLFVYV